MQTAREKKHYIEQEWFSLCIFLLHVCMCVPKTKLKQKQQQQKDYIRKQ